MYYIKIFIYITKKMTNILEQENKIEDEVTIVLQKIEDQTKNAINNTLNPFDWEVYYNNFWSINNKDMWTISLLGLKKLKSILNLQTSPEPSRWEAIEKFEQYLQAEEKEIIKAIDFEDKRTVAKFFRESGGIIKHYLNILWILAIQKNI